LANDRSDRIYLATESGLVICLREQGREFPRFHKYPEREPILPEFAPEGAAGEGDAVEEPGEMEGSGDKPDGDMPADDGDKSAAEKPDEDMSADERPEAEKPDAERPEDEKPDAEKSDEEPPADGDEKPAAGNAEDK
jgi:hypothetical protein